MKKINWETVKPIEITLKDLERVHFSGSYKGGGWYVCGKLYLIFKINPEKYMSLSDSELNIYTEPYFKNEDITMHMFKWADAILKTKLYEAKVIDKNGKIIQKTGKIYK